MEHINPLVPILVALIGIWLSYRLGYRQGQIAERRLSVDLKKATPSIGSRVEVQKYHPRPDITRYALVLTLYNDGELVASKLEGEWDFLASDELGKGQQIIRADSLPANHPLNYKADLICRGLPLEQRANVSIQANINLSYFGLDDRKENYSTCYHYDTTQKRMLQDKK